MELSKLGGKVEKDWEKEFITWTLGVSEKNQDIESTPWGQKPYMVGDVPDILRQWPEKRKLFEELIAQLKVQWPTNYEELKLWYRLFVEKEDKEAVFQYVLKDWKVFFPQYSDKKKETLYLKDMKDGDNVNKFRGGQNMFAPSLRAQWYNRAFGNTGPSMGPKIEPRSTSAEIIPDDDAETAGVDTPPEPLVETSLEKDLDLFSVVTNNGRHISDLDRRELLLTAYDFAVSQRIPDKRDEADKLYDKLLDTTTDARTVENHLDETTGRYLHRNNVPIADNSDTIIKTFHPPRKDDDPEGGSSGGNGGGPGTGGSSVIRGSGHNRSKSAGGGTSGRGGGGGRQKATEVGTISASYPPVIEVLPQDTIIGEPVEPSKYNTFISVPDKPEVNSLVTGNVRLSASPSTHVHSAEITPHVPKVSNSTTTTAPDSGLSPEIEEWNRLLTEREEKVIAKTEYVVGELENAKSQHNTAVRFKEADLLLQQQNLNERNLKLNEEYNQGQAKLQEIHASIEEFGRLKTSEIKQGVEHLEQTRAKVAEQQKVLEEMSQQVANKKIETEAALKEMEERVNRRESEVKASQEMLNAEISEAQQQFIQTTQVIANKQNELKTTEAALQNIEMQLKSADSNIQQAALLQQREFMEQKKNITNALADLEVQRIQVTLVHNNNLSLLNDKETGLLDYKRNLEIRETELKIAQQNVHQNGIELEKTKLALIERTQENLQAKHELAGYIAAKSQLEKELQEAKIDQARRKRAGKTIEKDPGETKPNKKSKVEEIKENLEKAEIQRFTAAQDELTLRAQTLSLRGNIREIEYEKDKLSKQLSDKDKEVGDAHNKYKELELKVATDNTKLEEATKSLSIAKQALEETREQNLKIQGEYGAEIVKLREQLASKISTLDKNAEDMQVLQKEAKENKDKVAERATLTAEKAHMEKEIARMEKELLQTRSSLETKLKEFESSNLDLTKRLETKSTAIAKVSENLKNSKEDINRLQKLNAEALERAINAEKKVEDVKIKMSEEAKQVLKKNLSKSKKENDKKIAKIQADAEHLHARAVALEKEQAKVLLSQKDILIYQEAANAAIIKSHLDKANESLQNKEDSIRSIQEELRLTKDENVQRQQISNELSQRVQDLEAELARFVQAPTPKSGQRSRKRQEREDTRTAALEQLGEITGAVGRASTKQKSRRNTTTQFETMVEDTQPARPTIADLEKKWLAEKPDFEQTVVNPPAPKAGYQAEAVEDEEDAQEAMTRMAEEIARLNALNSVLTQTVANVTGGKMTRKRQGEGLPAPLPAQETKTTDSTKKLILKLREQGYSNADIEIAVKAQEHRTASSKRKHKEVETPEATAKELVLQSPTKKGSGTKSLHRRSQSSVTQEV